MEEIGEKESPFDPEVYEFSLFRDPLNQSLRGEYRGVKLNLKLALARETNNGRPVEITKELIDTAFKFAKQHLSGEELDREVKRYTDKIKVDRMEEHRKNAGYVAGIESSLPTGDRD